MAIPIIVPFKERAHLNAEQVRAIERMVQTKKPYILGIDEVGIGCLAGPVTIGAVVLEFDFKNAALRDSKLLSHQQRVNALNDVIYTSARTHCVLSQPAEEIDRVGVGTVQHRLMEGAALYCLRRYPDSVVVIDGSKFTLELPAPIIFLAKADRLIPAVSAASILAKVTRDAYIVEQAALYPQYDLERSKGYGTIKHLQGLQNYGPCPLHRRSYRPVRDALAKIKPCLPDTTD